MLILVRHGRTEANANGLLQGMLDLPLDDLGVSQAAAVAARIGPPDVLISSPLLRARQTADAFGMPASLDERWVELRYGEYEGRRISDVSASVWSRLRTDLDFVLPGGESLRAMGARVSEACEELSEQARDRTVVVTTHVSPMKAAVAWALGVDLTMAWRCHLAYAAVCRIDFNERGPMLVSFNEPP